MTEVEELLNIVNQKLSVMIKAQIDRYFMSGRYVPVRVWIQMDREAEITKRMTDLIIVKDFIEKVVLGGENESGDAVSPPGGRPG